jgi:hypothetical protein
VQSYCLKPIWSIVGSSVCRTASRCDTVWFSAIVSHHSELSNFRLPGTTRLWIQASDSCPRLMTLRSRRRVFNFSSPKFFSFTAADSRQPEDALSLSLSKSFAFKFENATVRFDCVSQYISIEAKTLRDSFSSSMAVLFVRQCPMLRRVSPSTAEWQPHKHGVPAHPYQILLPHEGIITILWTDVSKYVDSREIKWRC